MSQLVFGENQFTGFFMTGTLALNRSTVTFESTVILEICKT